MFQYFPWSKIKATMKLETGEVERRNVSIATTLCLLLLFIRYSPTYNATITFETRVFEYIVISAQRCNNKDYRYYRVEWLQLLRHCAVDHMPLGVIKQLCPFFMHKCDNLIRNIRNENWESTVIISVSPNVEQRTWRACAEEAVNNRHGWYHGWKLVLSATLPQCAHQSVQSYHVILVTGRGSPAVSSRLRYPGITRPLMTNIYNRLYYSG